MDEKKVKNLINTVVGERYSIVEELNHGSFGYVFLGKDIIERRPVAIKVEHQESRHLLLQKECQLLCRIHKKGYASAPRVFYFGIESEFNVLVMDYMEASLENLFAAQNYAFSMKTILMIAIQTIKRIEELHRLFIIHRDIKPENFMIGRGKLINRIYIIDLGLSMEYIDRLADQHIPCSKNSAFVGTSRYGSLNAHRGVQQSRRDDLESLGYVLLYFLKGSLPWQSISTNEHTTRRQRRKQIYEMKTLTTLDALCSGVPNEFQMYLAYCRNRMFDEKPNYSYLRGLFRDLLTKMNQSDDRFFDWMVDPAYCKQPLRF